MYFIHALFQDFTDKLVIGFSREQADALMQGVDPHTFMTQTRRTFKSESDYEQWLTQNIFFKPLKILVKAKQETFKGENRQRFYAVDVTRIDIDGLVDHQSQEKVTTFKGENRVLLEKLSHSAHSTQ